MGGLGEVFAIDLGEEAGRNKSSTSTSPASWCVPTRTGDPGRREGRLKHSLTDFQEEEEQILTANEPELSLCLGSLVLINQGPWRSPHWVK